MADPKSLAGVPAPKTKVTAGVMRAALKAHFAHPNFGIVFEVAQGTGYNAHRHLDAVAMDTWPSHGLTLYGIEIKVDRADWNRECKDPDKAEQIARFLDLFYVAAPAGVVPIAELPEAWGLLELIPGKGIAITKKAAKTHAEPITRDFLAAIFRAAGRGIDPGTLDAAIASRIAELEANHREDVKHTAERMVSNNNAGAKAWAELMAALGYDEKQPLSMRLLASDDRALIQVIKAVYESGVMETWHGLGSLQKMLGDFKERVDKAMVDLSITPANETKARRRVKPAAMV